jgi:hypothetical protein
MVACQVTMEARPMETNPDTVANREYKEQGPKELESGAERREVPTEKAAVKSARVTKKRLRGRQIAAGQRVRPTKQIREDCES